MNAEPLLIANDRPSHDDPSQIQAERAFVPAIRRFWTVFRRHLWLGLGIIGIALVLAVLVTFLMTPKYTAVTRVEVSREADNVTNVQEVKQDDKSPNLEFYATQYALLDTRSLAERVAKRLNLASSEAFYAAHGKTLNPLFGNSRAPDATELRERNRKTQDLLLNHLTVAPIRGSALIDVMYTSGDAQLSAKIANTWAEEFASQSQDRRYASTADARAFLEQRLSDLRQRLEQSERDLVNYAASQNIVRLSESQNDEGKTRTTQTLASSDLASLNGALADATAARIAAEAQLRAVADNAANEQSIGNTALNQLRQQRAQAQADYADMLVQFDPAYPAAQALKEKVNALDASIAREETRVKQAVRTSLEAAEGREAALRTKVSGLLGRFNNESRASIQYNIYQREVDTNRELYDALLQRYKEIGVAGVGSSNIAIVDPANVPEKPSSPKLLLNLALGLLLGMALAVAAVLVLENLDEGIRDPEQLRLRARLPVLGVIPYIDESEDPIELLDDPKSELSEAYMSLRTNLAFSSSNGIPKSLAVTSSGPAEGKSTTSLALAKLIARSGRSVVLMDLDLRRPMIDRLIGSPRDFGMSNYLAGEDNLDALLQPTPKANLTFISAGPIPPSAAELLSGSRLSNLLKILGERFDHVIVDSSPVLGLSDAPLIGSAVDGILFVVQTRETPIRAVRHAIERLATPHSRIIGTVLTKFRAEEGAGYGYDYAYRYGHGETEPQENS